MVAVCATCNARIITSMHGRWFDPVAAVKPVTAFGKAHRCGSALHAPATIPLDTPMAVASRGRKTVVVNLSDKEI